MAASGATKEQSKEKVKEPKRYNVIMFNDDFTTMDFVVSILIEIFHMNAISAEAIMMSVHKSGKAVIGTYTYDVAVTKVRLAMNRAREAGYPFRMTVEEA